MALRDVPAVPAGAAHRRLGPYPRSRHTAARPPVRRRLHHVRGRQRRRSAAGREGAAPRVPPQGRRGRAPLLTAPPPALRPFTKYAQGGAVLYRAVLWLRPLSSTRRLLVPRANLRVDHRYLHIGLRFIGWCMQKQKGFFFFFLVDANEDNVFEP